jgi:hypothetical protein
MIQQQKKNVKPYDESLKEEIVWNSRMLHYFDNIIPTAWIPFILTTPLIESQDLLNIRKLIDQPKLYNFVYFASNCTQQIREKLFIKLKAYNEADKRLTRSYGKCQNTENNIPHPKQGSGWAENYIMYSEFKFVFAIENSLLSGYITEKILSAFEGNSVPIYYGPEKIKELINEKSFYYMNDRMKDPKNPTDEEFDKISKELQTLADDENETTGWKKFLKEPVWKDNKVPDFLIFNKDTQWIKDLGKDIRKKYDESIYMMPEKDINDNIKKLSKISFEINNYDVKNIKEHDRLKENINRLI